MKIIERGQKRPQYHWLGRYLCAYCRSVIELTADDAPNVVKAEEHQLEGWGVWIVCPVCEVERCLMDCNHVTGKCGGRGR